MDTFNRADLTAHLASKYDEIRDRYDMILDTDPDHKVFTYLIADTFETTDEDKFRYTDGANDLGIDFYICEENSYTIYQCKSVASFKSSDGTTFDAAPVNELSEAVDFLLEGERSTCSKEIQKLWENYNLNRDDNRLTAVLALEGCLSQSGLERFEERKKHFKKMGIDFLLIDEKTLFSTWNEPETSVKSKDIKLKLDIVDNGIMRMRNWFCAAVSIQSILKGMELYESALFDLNVRSKLTKSGVNNAIKNSLETSQGRKQFIHLNNGLVITCTSIRYSSDGSQVTLSGAQIINGCQTVNTIWDFYKKSDQSTKRELIDELKLMVKVISNDELSSNNLMDKIIIASNNQNPMNLRNLKSNSTEQIKIQKSLYSDPLKKSLRYFYIRKDGELDSFRSSNLKKQTPRKSDFEIVGSARKGNNRLRHIDNEEFGKIWLSWIGGSPSINSGTTRVFSDSAYRHIFLERPSSTCWERLKKSSFQQKYTEMEQLPPLNIKSSSPSHLAST